MGPCAHGHAIAQSRITHPAAASLFCSYLKVFRAPALKFSISFLTLKTLRLAVLEGNGEAEVAGNSIGTLALDQGGWKQRGRKAEGYPGRGVI